MKHPERIIDVSWEDEPNTEAAYKVQIIIEALDRMNLLVDVASTISGMGGNVLQGTMNSHSDGMVTMRFIVQVSDTSSIEKITDELQGVNGVFDARRATPRDVEGQTKGKAAAKNGK